MTVCLPDPVLYVMLAMIAGRHLAENGGLLSLLDSRTEKRVDSDSNEK